MNDCGDILAKFDLMIGIDTEYERHLDPGEIPTMENRVISYQAAIYSPVTGRRRSGAIIHEARRKGKRLSLKGFLSRVIYSAYREGFLEEGIPDRLRVIVAGHFLRADLPSFSDFPKLKKNSDLVQNTFTTTLNPLVYDVAFPNGRRSRVSITFLDTLLLAPVGKRSLANLGALLGLPKFDLPDVVDEKGNTVSAIGRMSLALRQHRAAFEQYAVRDAEIAVDWALRFIDFVRGWGLTRLPPTVPAAAVAKLYLDAGHQLPDVLGRETKTNGLPGDFLPEFSMVSAIAADAYHGGRGEMYVHGIFNSVPDKHYSDLDLRGAYTCAMAFFRPVDWQGIEHTKDLARLATLDEMSFLIADFSFPADTRFPSLPIYADNERGLVFPLRGRATVTGPELVVALSQGAKIRVRAGVRLPWKDAGGVRPFADYAHFINNERARHTKGSVDELLVKLAGNALYGKTGQAVGGRKSVRKPSKGFNSREGEYHEVPESKISSPPIAAYTAAMPRAVLGEILSRLPNHVQVLSVTTDGFLADATPDEIAYATSGPVCGLFSSLRRLVDPAKSPDILETKHEALSVLCVRTRTQFTIEPHNGSKLISARGSYRAEDRSVIPGSVEERDYFANLWRNRTYHTKLDRLDFISPANQWHTNGDLVKVKRSVRLNYDFDFKRRPVNIRDDDNGIVTFKTIPWPDMDSFNACRDDLDKWRKTEQAVLKTRNDVEKFLHWHDNGRTGSTGLRSSFQQAIMAAWIRGLDGFPKRGKGKPAASDYSPTLKDIADILTHLGVPGATRDALKNAAKDPDPTGSILSLTLRDIEFMAALEDYLLPSAIRLVLVFPDDVEGATQRPPKVHSTTIGVVCE